MRSPTQAARRRRATALGAALPLLALCVAAGPPEEAALVADLATGRVLHAHNAELLHPPASLAKLMTAYLAFEAVRDGRLTLDAPVPISRTAAGQPAIALGLEVGARPTAETLLRALILRSANDAAVALAEQLADSEAAFAERMTARARELGLARTRFRNASGLPQRGEVSTARELALLARALWRDFPERRDWFRARSVQLDGRRVPAVNGYLDRIPGALGLKTGFTCESGYGIVVIAQRGERQLLGVVLGAPTPEQRDERMDALLERAAVREVDAGGPTLASLAGRRDQGALRAPEARIRARVCLEDRPDRTPPGWVVDLGAAESARAAKRAGRARLRAHAALLRGGRPYSVPRLLDVLVHRVWIAGLDEAQAREACAVLRGDGDFCLALSPAMVRRAVARSRDLDAPSDP